MTFPEILDRLTRWAKVEAADAGLRGDDITRENFQALISLIGVVREQQVLLQRHDELRNCLEAEIARLTQLVSYR